jgi:hypothetical protein
MFRVCRGVLGRGRVKEGEFIYLYEAELRNLLQFLLVGYGGG